MVAEPTETPVTLPEPSTVMTEVFELDHVPGPIEPTFP